MSNLASNRSVKEYPISNEVIGHHIAKDGATMRTVIVGSGGTGGYFGGRLAAAGNDVTFVARGEHYQALRKNGLVVHSARGRVELSEPSVVDSLSKVEDPELVLVFVKTCDTPGIAEQLSRIIGLDTTVITFQTGLENDLEIKKEVHSERVFPGIMYINSRISNPGVIEQVSGPCTLSFGARGGIHDSKLGQIEAMFRAAEIDATNTNQIEYGMWKKLVWICAFSGITVLFRSSIGTILQNPKGEELFRKCLAEASAIAQSKGIDISAADRSQMLDKIDYYKSEGRNAKTSLLLDIENARRTEIETLHGTLVRYSRELRTESPLLELIYSIVQVHEANIAAI